MSKKQQTIVSVIAFILSFCLFTQLLPVMAERHSERDIKIWMNDFYVLSDVYPFIENDVTFVPIRFIAEELGYTVGWDSKEQTVSLRKDNTIYFLTIGSVDISISENGDVQSKKHFGNVIPAPRIKDDRTFVPLDILSLFQVETAYNTDTKVIVIGSGYQPNGFYHVKYYTGETTYLSADRFDIGTLRILKNGQDIQKLSSEAELLQFAKANAEQFFTEHKADFNQQSKVPANKQIFTPIAGQSYIPADPNDPLVGTWYGLDSVQRTANVEIEIEGKEYADTYNYITKLPNGRYHVTNIVLKANGSQLATKQYAEWDAGTGKFLRPTPSYETFFATGDFDYTWASNAYDMTLVGHDYMYRSDIDNDKSYYQKY